MKGILSLLKRGLPSKPEDDQQDSVMFSNAFAYLPEDGSVLIPWEARANEIGAKRLVATRGVKLMQGLWAQDKSMRRLDAAAISRLERFFQFATVPANRNIIRQDEYGNFMLVLLTGSIAIDRIQPWGENMRLTIAHPGTILGEMSLLDSGVHFSQCSSLNECEIAILDADALDEMMTADALLAAGLIGLLARKLSLRLRLVSAKLTDSRG